MVGASVIFLLLTPTSTLGQTRVSSSSREDEKEKDSEKIEGVSEEKFKGKSKT